MRCVPIGSATIWAHSARFISDSASLKSGPEESVCVCEPGSKNEGTRSRAHMRVTHVNNAYRGPRALLPESRSFGSQPTYYLFIRTVPGWSATWRNRLREFAEPAFLAQAPSELCFHSFRFSLSIPISFRLFSAPPFRLSSSSTLFRALSLSLFFSLLLYSHSMLSFHPSSNSCTLSHPLSSIKGYSRSIASSILLPSAPFLFSPFPPPDPCSWAYYVIRITIICFETASTAHQSDWQPVTRYV